MDAFADLHRDCAARGTLLFTITTHDLDGGVFRRAFTSHPREYPTHGTKPLTRDAWYRHCIEERRDFVANKAAEFAPLFSDHALITSMGLGSAANLCMIDDADRVVGTVNLLADEGHFTADRLAAYRALVDARRHDLLAHPALRGNGTPR
jgi:hypothetical protein